VRNRCARPVPGHRAQLPGQGADWPGMVRRAGLAGVLVAAAVTVAAPTSVAGQAAYLGCFAGLVLVAWLGVRRQTPGVRSGAPIWD